MIVDDRSDPSVISQYISVKVPPRSIEKSNFIIFGQSNKIIIIIVNREKREKKEKNGMRTKNKNWQVTSVINSER